MSPLRILALHGCGTGADVWRAQSQSIRTLLPQNWTYDFIDGEETCLPADGVDEVYPAPYFCYYYTPTFENVQAAHALVHDIVEEDGPFDAVMGFSQGAALAASVILHHQDENPFAPPLFRFAVFVNGSLPFSKTSSLGVDVSQIWLENCRDDGKVFTPTDDDSPLSASENDKDYFENGHMLQTLPIRRFSPRTHKDRIDIPTAHLYGQSDPWRAQSLRLVELCDQKQAVCFEHNGAHRVPRAQDQSQEMAKAILHTFQNAQFVSA